MVFFFRVEVTFLEAGRDADDQLPQVGPGHNAILKSNTIGSPSNMLCRNKWNADDGR